MSKTSKYFKIGDKLHYNGGAYRGIVTRVLMRDIIIIDEDGLEARLSVKTWKDNITK
jgi:hypothetical protein